MEYNLDDYQEVTNLNVRGNNPHLAVTCKAQGFSANNRPDALLFKCKGVNINNKELMKSLNKVFTEEELNKATFENKRKALEEALEDKLRGDIPSNNKDCFHLWVVDFNEDLVIFRYQDQLFAIEYFISDNSVIELGEGEIQHVKHRDMYIDSDTGEELIKAADWLKTLSDKIDGESSNELPLKTDSDDPDSSVDDEGATEGNTEDPKIVNEDTMTDKVKIEDLDLEELTKSAAVQELIKAAVAEAEQAKVAELEKAKLEEDTTELVKGFKGVEEDQVEVLVKALTSVDDKFGAALFKAFDGMQEAVKAAEAEVEEIKKSFGQKQDGVEGEVSSKTTVATSEGKQRTQDLTALVKARKEQNK
jgi:hypothetical protein